MAAMTVTIPAEYAEDVRSALVAEVATGTDALKSDQEYLLEDPGDDRARRAEDRDAAVRILSRDVALFEGLCMGAEEVAGEPGDLWHVFEALVRVLKDRLGEVCS